LKLDIRGLRNFIFTNKKKVKQGLLLYSVSITNIFIGILTSIIVTRNLDPSTYGDYKLLISIFLFAGYIVTFGFFISASRLLIFSYSKTRSRQIYGATLILLFVIYVIMVIGLLVYAFFDTNLYEKGLNKVFIILIPFSIVYPMRTYYSHLLQGDNRIKELSFVRLGPKIIYLFFLLLFLLLSMTSLKTVLLSFYLGFFITYSIALLRIKPILFKVRNRLNEILLMNKKYGFYVYTGSLFGVGIGQLSGVLISYFGSDNIDVGFFSLALMICTPLSIIPTIIATVYFKSFASYRKLPLQLILVTITASLVALGFLILLIKPVILFLYSEEYIGVVPIAMLVAMGVLLYGFGDFFNYFLRAHGRGKYLRNSAIISGVVLLGSNVLFIPLYGAIGAGIANIFGGFSYFVSLYVYYHKLVITNKNGIVNIN